MKKIIIILMILLMVSVVYAQSNQRTGFHVVIESYGYELIDYDITDKFKFDEEKFTTLQITIEKDNQQYIYYWIMQKDRYNELKEKV